MPVFLSFFFLIAIILDVTFRKSHKSLRHILQGKGMQIDEKRINTVYTLAFSLPYILFYMVKPFPLWYAFAWLLSTNIAYFIVWLFYERYINKLLPSLKLRINMIFTLLLTPFSIITLYFGIENNPLAIFSSGFGVAIATMISSLQEVYRAVKEI